MRCLGGCLMMIIPRLALLFVMVVKTPLIHAAFESWLWPCLGFVFMPITTLAYIWADINSNKHVVGFYLAVVVLGVLVDLGFLTGAGKQRYRSAPPAEF